MTYRNIYGNEQSLPEYKLDPPDVDPEDCDCCAGDPPECWSCTASVEWVRQTARGPILVCDDHYEKGDTPYVEPRCTCNCHHPEHPEDRRGQDE